MIAAASSDVCEPELASGWCVADVSVQRGLRRVQAASALKFLSTPYACSSMQHKPKKVAGPANACVVRPFATIEPENEIILGAI